MSYRQADLKAKLADLLPPETEFQVALIADFSSTLDESSLVAAWLALEVNASNRATFTTPALSGYTLASFVGAYFNFSISVVNSSGSALEWTHYAILDAGGALKTYLRVFSGNTVPASTTQSRDLALKIEYATPIEGGG